MKRLEGMKRGRGRSKHWAHKQIAQDLKKFPKNEITPKIRMSKVIESPKGGQL